jgi:GlpG protein
MRLIGTLEDEHKGLAFSRLLTQKGITHQLDLQKNTDWESPHYGSSQCQVWIQEEDQVEEAVRCLNLFVDNPQNSSVQPPPPKIESSVPPSSPSATPSLTAWDRQPMGGMTRGLLITCCVLFFLTQWMTPTIPVPERYAGFAVLTSPVEKALLYDYPRFYVLLDEFIQLYGYEGLEKPTELPPDGQHLLAQINNSPFWPGIYALLLKGGLPAVEKGLTSYSLFEKIREGQVWRLFSPCLLHGDLFHLLFNMLWLIVLGKQIEQRLQPWRYALFILFIGIFSNTAQYLISGPNFIGFSGVICGMLAFIWVRQQRAAWEGYQLDRLTLIFMLIFILGMAFIQLLSFVLEKSFQLGFTPGLANTAHLAGGLIGLILGRLSFFSWRHA